MRTFLETGEKEKTKKLERTLNLQNSHGIELNSRDKAS